MTLATLENPLGPPGGRTRSESGQDTQVKVTPIFASSGRLIGSEGIDWMGMDVHGGGKDSLVQYEGARYGWWMVWMMDGMDDGMDDGIDCTYMHAGSVQ